MNKARLILLCCTIFLGLPNFAQSPLSLNWLNNSKGTSWDLVSDMVIDKENNVYLVGNYQARDTNNRLKITGKKLSFIEKLDSEGRQIWTRKIVSNNYTHFSNIQIGRNGELLISGCFSDEMEFGSDTLRATQGIDAFFVVMSIDGDIQFLKQLSGDFHGFPLLVFSRIIDSGYWFIGSYSCNLAVDKFSCKGNYNSDIFIGSFNQKGELDNYSLLTGKGEDIARDVIVNNSGQLIISGSFEENLTVGNKVLASRGRTDAFLLRFDPNLQLVGSEQIGGSFDDSGIALYLDKDQDIFWSGGFAGEVTVNNKQILLSNGNQDVFICKYNFETGLVWADQLGGVGNEYVSSIAINKLNSIFLTGSYKGTIKKSDFQITSTSSIDVFIAKYHENGDFKYIESFGGDNSDYARRLSIDTSNSILLTGNFQDFFVAIDDSTKKASDEDYFLAQLYDCSFSTPIQLPPDTSICGEFFTIVADTGYVEYMWNNTQGCIQIQVDSTNMYHLAVKDKYSCISQDSIHVNIYHKPIVELGSDTTLIVGETIRLMANPDMENYLWNNQSVQQYLDINTAELAEGNFDYSVIVTDTNLCLGRGEITITVVEKAMDYDSKAAMFTADLYPNPSYDFCHIRLQNIDIANSLSLEFYTLEGVQVLDISPETHATAIELRLNLQNFPSGIYLVIIKNGTAVLKERVAVVK